MLIYCMYEWICKYAQFIYTYIFSFLSFLGAKLFVVFLVVEIRVPYLLGWSCCVAVCLFVCGFPSSNIHFQSTLLIITTIQEELNRTEQNLDDTKDFHVLLSRRNAPPPNVEGRRADRGICSCTAVGNRRGSAERTEDDSCW